MRFTERAVDELLDAWPLLRRAPSREVGTSVVVGTLAFNVAPPGLPRLEDAYEIRLEVPIGQRDRLPIVFETDGRIPRAADHHVNTVDGDLCLGSPWAIRRRMGTPPTLLRFVDQSVIPYLYAATWRGQGRDGWPFGELQHDARGLLDDYAQSFRLEGAHGVGQALQALARRHRLANRLPCPCGCGKRLGRCGYRWHLASLRSLASRGFFRRLRDDWSMRMKPRTQAALRRSA